MFLVSVAKNQLGLQISSFSSGYSGTGHQAETRTTADPLGEEPGILG